MSAHARVTVECEEEGFLLRVDAGTHQSLRLIDNPEELYDSVRTQIGPWLRERDEARATRTTTDEDAYELSDPKHPRHHQVFADLATKEKR